MDIENEECYKKIILILKILRSYKKIYDYWNEEGYKKRYRY